MSGGNGSGWGGKKYIKHRTARTGRRDNNISSIAKLVKAQGLSCKAGSGRESEKMIIHCKASPGRFCMYSVAMGQAGRAKN